MNYTTCPNKIRIATRKSKLALWQSEYVAEQLRLNFPNIKIEFVTMQTKGDRILDKPLNLIGGKALFMKELEVAMLNQQADIAVHSLKDVPYQLPDGFTLAAFCKREEARDAFVSNKFSSLNNLPYGSTVGTSSLRRKAQLLHYRPDLNIIDLRGNVNTRLQKLDNGEYDAIILAAAGLIRLNFNDKIKELIDPSICLPAVGQGVVTIEVLSKNEPLRASLETLNDFPTYKCIRAERSFNKTLKGGCHAPVAANACINKEGIVTLTGLVASMDGKKIIKARASGSNFQQIGKGVAQELLKQGAYKILNSKN